jgi:hypothetical protein
MKRTINTAMLSALICFSTINALGQKTGVQKVTTLTRLQATNLSWYITAKQNFYKSLKNVEANTVMARKNVSGGFQELGPSFNEDQVEREKSSTTTKLQNGKVICRNVSKEFDLSIKPEFNILKFSSQSQIFPGVISTADAILSESVVTPTGLPARKPMTINISLPGASASSFVLDNAGTAQPGKVNDIIRNNNGIPIPAMIGASLTEVDSKFDFAAELEASSGLFLPLEEFGVPAEVNAGAEFSGNVAGSNKRRTYLLKFIQPMFILSHNEFNSANIFQDAAAAASKSNLVMINSVTYGRMVFIRIVSEESAINVKTAIKGKLGIELTELNVKAGHGIEGSGSTNFSTVVKDFKAVVIGGNITAASRIITDPTQLKGYIDDVSARTLSLNTGAVPISFTMVRLSDYASLGIRSVANFQAVQDCQAINGYSIFISRFGVSKVVDNPLAGNNEDLFGSITVQAFYKKADGTEAEIKDENGRSATVWSESSSSPLQLKEGEFKHLFKTDGSVQDGKRRFIFTPEQEATGYVIIKYRIKDKIMTDGEQLGNSNSSMKYEEKDLKFFLKDWKDIKDVSGCISELKEVGGDAKLCIDYFTQRD